jgi:hypothetical protein
MRMSKYFAALVLAAFVVLGSSCAKLKSRGTGS